MGNQYFKVLANLSQQISDNTFNSVYFIGRKNSCMHNNISGHF